jgi:hypothetical protein
MRPGPGNQDPRFVRYQNDPTFHRVVRSMDALIEQHGFTHQDLIDAVFVAYMRFLERNPIPLNSIPGPG